MLRHELWVTDSQGTAPSETEIKVKILLKELNGYMGRIERKGQEKLVIVKEGNFKIQDFRNEEVLSTIITILVLEAH